jgi:rubrerythrin
MQVEDAPLEQFLTRAAELERAVAGLYAALALRYPDDAEFWNQMAADEHEHAEALESLESLFEAGVADVNPMRPMVFEIEEGVAFVSGERLKLEDERATLDQALQTSKLIESSQLEKHYSRHLIGITDAARELFAGLARAERDHIDRLNNFGASKGVL